MSQFNLLCENTRAKAIDLPSGGHFLTPEETRIFLGDSMTVTYWNGTQYVDSVATYDSVKSSPSGFVEVSESPVGFVAASGALWLQYTCTLTGYNNNNNYIAFRCHPTYSLYDTEFIYTCYAFSSASQISSTYTSPSSDWYMGGSNLHFENSALSAANSGYKSYLRGNSSGSGNLQYCSYVPIVHTSSSAFSGYSIQATFQGNTGYLGYSYFTFFVMCPYVSGDAYGNSGTFDTQAGGGGSVDLSETNSLLGDILNGLAPISDLVDLLSDDVDIPVAGTVADMPYDNEDYDNMILTADAILDDIPDTVAAASFWVEITNAFFPENSWLRVIMPLLMIMALMSWLLWKK